MRPSVLAYHFPQWHLDPRNEKWHGRGWTEWDLVRANVARFEGHVPLRPAWGCHDEADPSQMAREIDLAADHGVDGFLFDVYWYEDGAFLDRAITEGFLGAPNRRRMKFACMWANHTWRNWHPCKATQQPWKDEMLVVGRVSRESFDRFAGVVAEWMSRPEYFRVNGRPYFSMYEVRSLVDGLGGEDAAAAALDSFRDVVRKRAGVEPHIGAVCNRLGVSGEAARQRARRLGLESITPYNAMDHGGWGELDFPVGSFDVMQKNNRAAWTVSDGESGLAYIPNLTSGWDCSGRAALTDRWERRDYPWLPVVMPTRAQWAGALAELKAWFDGHPAALPVATLNAWNEWTEGAVLLPDEQRGLMLLEEVRRALGRAGE